MPPESKALGGWFVSPRSPLASRRIRVEWLFKSPEWMDVNWTNFPLNRERHYEIYVGHSNGVPAYGHFIEFSFHPGYDDIESHVKKSTVEWTDAGAIFKEPSGHVLFIPKNMFIGGR